MMDPEMQNALETVNRMQRLMAEPGMQAMDKMQKMMASPAMRAIESIQRSYVNLDFINKLNSLPPKEASATLDKILDMAVEIHEKDQAEAALAPREVLEKIEVELKDPEITLEKEERLSNQVQLFETVTNQLVSGIKMQMASQRESDRRNAIRTWVICGLTVAVSVGLWMADHLPLILKR